MILAGVALFVEVGYLCSPNSWASKNGSLMIVAEVCLYEKAILKFRKWFFVYSLLAVAVPIAVTLAVWCLDKPSSWISRSGAVMAGIAFLAHLKSTDMMGVLTPGGMVGMSFGDTRKKYLPQIVVFGRVAIAVVLIGTAVWGFGDLLPVGLASAQ
ncbi:hypothetical protein RHM65_18745 [Pseudomonas sp. CCI4.2]|uniref:hypothetical protein n=1 Tax=Pseudomonas sp. CCI4.2 TaxID=3048620 RepID=UPI002AC972B3|nr:hypothetical protein [Pseudomonas sp. CCI4.2]MEB0090795.1 hypothetical protein [Pseudomonas sp. CCI4.2]WPX52831.1 hypothetical protein RHM65_18745 [Pseudomonas sp. CCI4.2]